MTNKLPRESILAKRIASGEADPITPLERQIAAQIREMYEKKFGPYHSPFDGPTPAKQPSKGFFDRLAESIFSKD